MLEQIDVHGVATYMGAPQKLDGLRAINFIYGANGSGKTTISRVIAAPDRHATCGVTWARNLPLESLVYNRDFVADNFTSRMRGIFTLGQQDADIIQKIEDARREGATLQDTINNRSSVRASKIDELDALNVAFKEDCWKAKLKHEPKFKEAFQGVLNAKERFAERMFREATENGSDLHELAALEVRAATLFGEFREREASLQSVGVRELTNLETSTILSKRVIGKEDVDIAGLIRKLGNSDWVKEGLKYFHDDKCPFCQQDTNHKIRESLNEYFDEQYQSDLDAIATLIRTYASNSDAVLLQIEGLTSSRSQYLDVSTLMRLHETLRSTLSLNEQHLSRKKKEPSSTVTLETIKPLLDEINELIAAANSKIEEHNSLVDNIVAERAALVSDIWRFLAEENSLSLGPYLTQRVSLTAAIEGLTAGINGKTSEREAKLTALRELEKTITSVQPTVTAINQLLASFGFRNFKLATAGDDELFYRIIRSDGSEAGDTLSEGEKTFITFLYFYHLISGSVSDTGTTANRVVVFDDPVSSLDSDVLFIVSSLIKKVFLRARDPASSIKQVFILTHNIYFHKEVAFDPSRSGDRRAFETFWVIRKMGDQSQIVGHTTNPIKTSYELLWQEVRDENRSHVTIQNTLRRILENYFVILGDVDKDTIVGKFDGEDQQVCNSLFSWVNDGSHSAHEDLYLVCDDQTVERYLRVFKEVFEKTEQRGHYEMMIRPR